MIDAFSNLSDMKEQVFEKDEVLLTEGQETPGVYILKEGAVSFSFEGEELGRSCTPNTVFGEISALLNMENTATVIAVEKTTVWVIEDFDAFMRENPEVAIAVSKELARRLSNMNFNFIELRTALKKFEETGHFLDKDGQIVPFSEAEKVQHKEAYGDEDDDILTVKRGQPIVITGLRTKVTEFLNKPLF